MPHSSQISIFQFQNHKSLEPNKILRKTLDETIGKTPKFKLKLIRKMQIKNLLLTFKRKVQRNSEIRRFFNLNKVSKLFS